MEPAVVTMTIVQGLELLLARVDRLESQVEDLQQMSYYGELDPDA